MLVGRLFVFLGRDYPPLCKKLSEDTFINYDDNCVYQVPLFSAYERVAFNDDKNHTNAPINLGGRNING